MSDTALALTMFLTMWGTAMAVVVSCDILLITAVLLQHFIN